MAWLTSIHVYPVKGCHRLDVADAGVLPWGLACDRRWMLVDEQGVMLTQRDEPRLALIQPWLTGGGIRLTAAGTPPIDVPSGSGERIEVTVWRDTVPASLAGTVAHDWVRRVTGLPDVRLVYLDDPGVRPVDPRYGRPGDRVTFADGYPLLLTSAASLAALNALIRADGEVPVPMNRFRPNVVVDGVPAWAEDDWVGRRVRIGAVTLRAVKPCARCVVTTTDQETAVRGREPLRALGRHRNVDQKLLFGLNLIPDGQGVIAIGDDVATVA